MPDRASCVFLTMPTSGTGSLWRIITAIGGPYYKQLKIAEQLEVAGKQSEIPEWKPEERGYLYMYNTPHFINKNLSSPSVKLITNFRDPRDLACNQYHWAFQHPMLGKSQEYIENYRKSVAEEGIDRFVARQDNNVLFRSLRALAPRLESEDQNVLRLSYSQLCLDFDRMLDRLITFLEVPRDSVPWETLEKERAVNLQKNPSWIGQIWSGSDIMPGRYRKELKPETIAAVDDRYRQNLQFVRSLEVPALRSLLATEAERGEMDRVFVGRADELFLKNDANNTIDQITGRTQIPFRTLAEIGSAHRARQTFGQSVGGFEYCHAVIPSKEVSHRHLLPEDLQFEAFGKRPIEQYAEAGLGSLWQPYYGLSHLEMENGRRFFPSTDSHWNHDGALRYLEAVLETVDPELAQRTREMQMRRFAGKQQGDLGLKLELPPETIQIVTPLKVNARLVFDNDVTNEGCVRWYRNTALSTGRRALVLHDGFTLWLLGILPEIFSEIVFCHGSVFDYDFVRRLAPDVVLCLQAERSFPRVPDAGGNLLSYVADQEAQKNATRHLADFIASEPRFI